MARDQLFYVGQKALIERNSEVLILNDPEFGLDLPGGKVQEEEIDFDEALKREVREETGIEIEVGAPFFRGYFEFPEDSKHRNRGKKIFVIFYKTKYVSGDLQLSEEHDSYKWVNNKSYKKLVSSQMTKINIKALNLYFEN